MNKPFAVGIIGTGHIAAKMAYTLRGMEDAELCAVASRRQETADRFAAEWGAAGEGAAGETVAGDKAAGRCEVRAYGSYEAMMDDPAVELVYIATPHPMHRENALMCIRHGKPVLCEKPFTVNAREAEEVLCLAREKGVFITEAIWTRYMPLSQTIGEIVASGVIGAPVMISANLGYPIAHKERSREPALAGGALLDLGIYPINFASMVFGGDVEEIASSCVKMPTGVDAQNSITITFGGGRMAVLHSSMWAKTDRRGIISGERGHIVVENINNPESVTVVDEDYRVVAQYDAPRQITGFEYQVRASMEAVRGGLPESPFMPHAETLRIMRLMDGLRREWGIRYPFE